MVNEVQPSKHKTLSSSDKNRILHKLRIRYNRETKYPIENHNHDHFVVGYVPVTYNIYIETFVPLQFKSSTYGVPTIEYADVVSEPKKRPKKVSPSKFFFSASSN